MKLSFRDLYTPSSALYTHLANVPGTCSVLVVSVRPKFAYEIKKERMLFLVLWLRTTSGSETGWSICVKQWIVLMNKKRGKLENLHQCSADYGNGNYKYRERVPVNPVWRIGIFKLS